MNLAPTEILCAKIAAKVVSEAGGFLSFDDYDTRMRNEIIFPPFHWCQGWGNTYTLLYNQRVLAAFAAVIEGLLEQTPNGYRTVPEGAI